MVKDKEQAFRELWQEMQDLKVFALRMQSRHPWKGWGFAIQSIESMLDKILIIEEHP